MKAYNVMLLAAGLGTRLRPYTLETPKPAIPFLGVPLGYYPLSLMEDLNLQRVIVNTHHLPEKIEQLYRALPRSARAPGFALRAPDFYFSSEREKILGSGGGIRQALPQLLGRESFLVANADELIFSKTPFLMKEFVQFHEWNKGVATLLTMAHPEVGEKFGGVWGEPGPSGQFEVRQFSKTKIAGYEGQHFVGVMIFRDSIKNYFSPDLGSEENILYGTLTRAMAAGEKVFTYKADLEWFETGNPVDFLSATKVCLEALKKQPQEPWVLQLKSALSRFKYLKTGFPKSILEEGELRSLIESL
jgi:mannose-1-phosphate guanylyltransferase